MLTLHESSRVIHSIVQHFAPPQRVRVVKFQQVDTAARIHVAATVYFWVAVTSEWRNDLFRRNFILTFVVGTVRCRLWSLQHTHQQLIHTTIQCEKFCL